MHIELKSLFVTELLLGIAIFAMAITCGALPLLLGQRSKKQSFLFYGESFAGGVLLGAGFMHLLAESLSQFARDGGDVDYVWVMGLTAATIFVLRFIEDGVSGFFDSRYTENLPWMAYLLVLLLSVHSVIAGAALGFSHQLIDAFVVGGAILAHKGSAAFAMVVKMQRHKIPRQRMVRLLILFSFMTPLGMMLAGSINHWLASDFGSLTEAQFNAVAAGTFIYIATQYTCEKLPCEHKFTHILHLLTFAVGLFLTGAIARWI